MAKAGWHYSNVLKVEPDSRELWQFTTDGDFKLVKELRTPADEVLPPKLVNKSWRSLAQKKLNVAWLPPEEVFLRVVQLPVSTHDELASMVELQLEKLAPMPVGQAVWTLLVVPPKKEQSDNLQTLVVVIVARNVVEQFLGTLEANGYQADRLELKFLDQLLSTDVQTDGVWIYPGMGTDKTTFVLAWWYGGVLRHIGLVNVPAGEAHGETIKEQLLHMSWSGEMEGWLTSSPQVHLVADPEAADLWEPLLNEGAENPIKIVLPVPDKSLALLTARRAVSAEQTAGLMPPEYSGRYHQQFVDRLWMRGLLSVVMVYIFLLIAYFGALQAFKIMNRQISREMAVVGPNYTNSIALKAKIKLVEDQMNLKTAAMDSLKAVSKELPQDYVLTWFSYSEKDGDVEISGTAPKELALTDPLKFFNDLKKASDASGASLFTGGDEPNTSYSGNNLTWRFKFFLSAGGRR